MNKLGIGIYNSYPRHLHIEPTSDCNARCPQCPRTLHGTLHTNPNIEIAEWTPEETKQVLSDSFFKNLKKILVNGNLGDIVKHSTPKEFLEELIKKNVVIEIRTNGGALKTEFWSWLGTQPNIIVEFGIDGLEDTHHLYRRKTRYDVVIKNAKAYIEAGGYASWAMTVFKHNEHQVDKCRDLSKELGFKKFKARDTTRWWASDQKVFDKNLDYEYSLEPASSVKYLTDNKKEYTYSREYLQEQLNTIHKFNVDTLQPMPSIQSNKVSCLVEKTSSVYLSADKKLWPCCWTANEAQTAVYRNSNSPFVEKVYKQLGYDVDFNNVVKRSVRDVLATGIFRIIENSWSGDCFSACAHTCGKNSVWRTQLKNTKITNKK